MGYAFSYLALMALMVEYELHGDGQRASLLLNAWRKVLPTGIHLGEALYESGDLARLRQEGADAAQMITLMGKRLHQYLGRSPKASLSV